MPRGGGAAGFAVDVVKEAAAPGAGSLIRGHGGVHDVDTPFDVGCGGLGGALGCPHGGNGVRSLRGGCWGSKGGGSEAEEERTVVHLELGGKVDRVACDWGLTW